LTVSHETGKIFLGLFFQKSTELLFMKKQERLPDSSRMQKFSSIS